MAANAAIIILFFINIPNSRCKICDNSVIITIFANQKSEDRLQVGKKQAFCTRFALSLCSDLSVFRGYEKGNCYFHKP